MALKREVWGSRRLSLDYHTDLHILMVKHLLELQEVQALLSDLVPK